MKRCRSWTWLFNRDDRVVCHLEAGHEGSHRGDTRSGQRFRWERETERFIHGNIKRLADTTRAVDAEH